MLTVAIVGSDAADWLTDAVRAVGGELAEPARADALLVDAGAADDLDRVLAGAPRVRWVQLSFTGVERFLHLMREDQVWTCARGVFGPTVGEHALALALAGLRGLPQLARQRSWNRWGLRSLLGARVVVVGGGSIGRSVVELLEPFRCKVEVLTSRSTRPLTEAARDVDVVFLAAPLTTRTAGMVGEPELRAMGARAWLVNVARGGLVRTDDLVRALSEGWIAGAALDVTDPEPLPEGHPLWTLDNCLVTPHVASVMELAQDPYASLVTENLRRFSEGRQLLGLVDRERGY
jgi:D-3-phosphoglycerate dehydrogenase